MTEFVLALDEFMINNKICIQLNYSIELERISGTEICTNIQNDLQTIINDFDIKEEGLIFLLDISKVNPKDLDISKVKKILTHVSVHFPDMLNKCIVYNYNKKVKLLFNLIKNFLDKKTSDKIVVDESISKILNTVTNNPAVLNQLTTNNN